MAVLTYTQPPIVEVRDPVLTDSGVRLLIWREDLNHRVVSGNKWWKLKYNLEEALRLKQRTLLTFGGAFSNHIYATAGAANQLGFESVGIIRGEETLPLNPVLAYAVSKGMRLHYVSRGQYHEKIEESFLHDLKKEFGAFYLIPEGGTNSFAIKGCEELGRKIKSEIDFDHLCLSVGTGGTLAGIVAAFAGERNVIGFSALKGGEFLESDVKALLAEYGASDSDNWRIETDYHFGGYAKTTPDLVEFIGSQQERGTPLDRVYTSKMLFGVYDLVQKGIIKGPCTVLALHTGGLQTAGLPE